MTVKNAVELAGDCRACSGPEMAAYCGCLQEHRDAVLGLPEFDLELIQGAGGTVRVTQRVGR